MGKWAQRRLEELGARPMRAMGEGNDDADIRADFEAWQSELWETLAIETGGSADEGGDAGGAGADEPPEPNFECEMLSSAAGAPTDLAWLSAAFPKFRLLRCDVAVARELTSDVTADSGSVRHVELSCAAETSEGQPGTLVYDGADDLGVCCDNGVRLAHAAAARLGLPPTAAFELRVAEHAVGMAPPLPTPCTVEQALRYHCDLRAPVSKPLLSLLAAHASSPAEADRLRHLASPAGKVEYADYVARDGRGVLEVLTAFGSCTPPLAALLELVPKMAPRYYTISSSPLHATATVHLTVKVLREPMRGAESRVKEGLCSTQLGALEPGGSAVAFVRPSAFRLPNEASAPVVMVGPGTGVAPFRAFTQQLEVARQAGHARRAETRLYFGCRRPDVDYLYREELLAAERSGALTTVRTAFSRAGADKVYVQQRLREDGAALFQLLHQQGGYLYICGGTTMGREVVALVNELFVMHGSMSATEASSALKKMAAEGRLVQELWS